MKDIVYILTRGHHRKVVAQKDKDGLQVPRSATSNPRDRYSFHFMVSGIDFVQEQVWRTRFFLDVNLRHFCGSLGTILCWN